MLLKPCQLQDIKHLMDEYLQTLASPFDFFLESHILSSEFHVIVEDDIEIGYYAIHQTELLTQFFIRSSYLKQSQRLFDQVIRDHTIQSLFISTSDELFVSLAIDKDYTVTKQAYFFQDSRIEATDSCWLPGDVFSLATQDDRTAIQTVCGDFFEQLEEQIMDDQVFMYYRDDVLLGVGHIEKSKLLKGYVSIGMFTNGQYRNQGIGRELLRQLKLVCYDQQLMPIAGCWYYNHASKKTLEGAGMVTRSRLLNVKVTIGV